MYDESMMMSSWLVISSVTILPVVLLRGHADIDPSCGDNLVKVGGGRVIQSDYPELATLTDRLGSR